MKNRRLIEVAIADHGAIFREQERHDAQQTLARFAPRFLRERPKAQIEETGSRRRWMVYFSDVTLQLTDRQYAELLRQVAKQLEEDAKAKGG